MSALLKQRVIDSIDCVDKFFHQWVNVNLVKSLKLTKGILVITLPEDVMVQIGRYQGRRLIFVSKKGKLTETHEMRQSENILMFDYAFENTLKCLEDYKGTRSTREVYSKAQD